MATANQPVRIGLVLVHGVGEQRRFDHLRAEVTNLAAALEALGGTRVSIETRATQDAEQGAANEGWRADGSTPVKIHVARGAQRYVLCVHEVWWADLDDKETLRNRVKFWLWGLGFWFVRKFSETANPGAHRFMRPPHLDQLSVVKRVARELFVRLRLFTFAIVFLQSALTINLINYVLRQLRLGQLPLPGIEVFYQFVGDVKLYQDRGKPHLGPLTDLGSPRRVAIRRRMMQVLLDAYRASYDRWYILAHSLGSVVALNGIMETAHSLPNYLSQEAWASLAGDPVVGKIDETPDMSKMRPPRPVWVAADDATLDRSVLFARLRGLVTYGSPLDKFAYLWPQIVNVNNDTRPWDSTNGVRAVPFEWLNVYEHTDPVAGRLTAYGTDPASQPSAPRNLAYRASWVLLLSHLKYLALRRRNGEASKDQLVLRLLEWILAGAGNFAEPAPSRYWYAWKLGGFGVAIRAPMWVAASAAFTLLLAYLGIPAILDVLAWLSSLPLFDDGDAPTFFESVDAAFAGLSPGERMLLVLGVSVGAVIAAGIARRILEVKPRAGEPQRANTVGRAQR